MYFLTSASQAGSSVHLKTFPLITHPHDFCCNKPLALGALLQPALLQEIGHGWSSGCKMILFHPSQTTHPLIMANMNVCVLPRFQTLFRVFVHMFSFNAEISPMRQAKIIIPFYR